ncbi:MarR family winged helix-turn-helix transcriptional regulator [Bradyrhizobium betae]|uniref:HTH marR-type domain-containing protein n=1 Tax=Bradyrhizobium betae TaxID=244734 RepID=A0A4Q1VNH3_9BRAD|nr:helix-turn-helix domain-containing protein [Bradyrhizobium betae]RXT54251.1 hypothetical protein B5V03_02085 [Bradyrhizobium betae]
MSNFILKNLLKAAYWIDDAVQENMEAHGFPRVSRAVSWVLLNIAQGDQRQTDIARNLGISRQAVGKLLIELRHRGIVELQADPRDKRSRIVRFSKKHDDQKAACISILTALEVEIRARIGARVFDQMKRGLSADWGKAPRLEELSLAKKQAAGKLQLRKQVSSRVRARLSAP